MRPASDMGWWCGGDSLYDIIQDVGATAGLKICLDAGALESYDGTGQQWLDMSGNSTNFYRGTDATSEAADPTFSGQAGGLSAAEYFSTDGGDAFTLAGATPAWVNALHRDNAAFTLLTAWYSPGSAGYYPLLGDMRQSGADVGFLFGPNNTGKLRLIVGNAAGDTFALDRSTDAVVAAGWHVHAVSLDETATGFFWGDGAYLPVGGANTFSAVYSSPATAAASYAVRMLAATLTNCPNATRIAGVAAWQGAALTKASLDKIFTQLRWRFGL